MLGDLQLLEGTRIKFMLGATYDQLPTSGNLAHRKVAGSDRCRVMGCSAKGMVEYVLSNRG